MDVILKETVPALGQAGETVKVNPGYARNYLLPRKLAVTADPRNKREMEHWMRMAKARQAKEKVKTEALAKTIEGLALEIKKPSGEGGKLFGAVTGMEIAEALRKHEIVVNRRQVLLEKPVKTLGVFEVKIKLHAEVQATLKVEVVKE